MAPAYSSENWGKPAMVLEIGLQKNSPMQARA